MTPSSLANSLHSDSDSEPEPRPIHRTNYLSAIGLLQRPITDEQDVLPPLPPHRNSSPSIVCPPSNPSHQNNPAPLGSIRFQQDDNDIQAPLSKMEAAFAKYLGIDRELDPDPSTSKSPRSFRHSDQYKRSSKSFSIQRPVSEDLKSNRPVAEVSWPSNGNGFRAWFSGVSKHRSSISGLRSISNPPSELTRPSVSGPIDTFNPNSHCRLPEMDGPSCITPVASSSTQSGYVETRNWSSLMDASTLALYSEKEKNRQEAIFELINTEAMFVENCQILSQIFYLDLEPLIGSRATAKIFCNIEDIMIFGTTFLSALERRQVESRSHVARIGDIVIAYMLRVDVFKPYCSNQATASRLLNDFKQKPAVFNRLNGLKVKGLELEHYLLQPMQRLTRYPLLIAQIMKYTDENSPDYERLARALKKVQQVLVSINEAIRQQDDHFRLLNLSEKLMIPGSDVKLSLATMTRFVGPRRLIREGVVSKIRSRKTLHAYLFNDFFLLTKPSSSSNSFLEMNQSSPKNQHEIMYRAPMALEETQFLPGRDDQTFLVLYASETFSLKVHEGSKICKAWLSDLRNSRADVMKALAASKSKRATWAADQKRRSKSLERLTKDSTRQKIVDNNKKKENNLKLKQRSSDDSLSITPDTSFSQFIANPSSSSATSILPSLNKKSIRINM